MCPKAVTDLKKGLYSPLTNLDGCQKERVTFKICFRKRGGNCERDLSDKSQNDKDSEKHRENSDSASLLPDDVFIDGFNSPECAKILIV